MSNISQLAKLQADFQAYLLDEQAVAEFNNHAITKSIISDAKVGVKRRLGIYYDGYRLRIIEALASSYPKLKQLLGDDLFDTVARNYITEYPSTYRNMRWYGGNMQTHLQNTLPQHPVAAEMANLEWALSLAFDAEDTPTISLNDLAAIPPEDWAALKFSFQPALQIVRFRWNIIAIWKALDIEETPPAPMQDSTDTTWLIWRKALNSHFRSITETEAIAINLAMSNDPTKGTFGDICELLAMESEKEAESTDAQDAMTMAAQFLANWITDDMICKAKLID